MNKKSEELKINNLNKKFLKAAKQCIKAGKGCNKCCPYYKECDVECFQKFMQELIIYLIGEEKE